MKSIPDTICAATRDGLTTTRPAAGTSMNRYYEVSMKSAPDTQPDKCGQHER
jgi:hypothetical protein